MQQKQGSVKAAPSANHPSPAPAREQDAVRGSDSARWAQATASTFTILSFLPDSILPTPQTGWSKLITTKLVTAPLFHRTLLEPRERDREQENRAPKGHQLTSPAQRRGCGPRAAWRGKYNKNPPQDRLLQVSSHLCTKDCHPSEL